MVQIVASHELSLIVSRRPEPVSLVTDLQGMQATRGREEAEWVACCYVQPARQQPTEEQQDFVDIEGFDPQLRKHRTVMQQEPKACHFLRLTEYVQLS
jgi:hypothetical protein